MKLRNRTSLFVLLMICLVIVGCVSATSLINAIVLSAEAVLPYITQLSPADQMLVATYVNGAATITDTLLFCGSGTASCVAMAVSEFNKLVLPTLSASASPTVKEALAVVSVAIAAFVAAEGLTSVSATSPTKKVEFSISDSNKTKFKARLTAVKTKLVPYLSHNGLTRRSKEKRFVRLQKLQDKA